MTTYDFVHLVIHAAGGEIQGRTKLQKVVYFVGVLTGRVDRLGYRPHYYGPYSPDVSGSVEELRGLRFLEQHAATAGKGDESGFEVTRYDYKLTEEGKQVAQEKADADPELWEQIKAAIQRLNVAVLPDYIQLAIAAKTDLLTRREGKPLSQSDLKHKTAEYGWKTFSDDQYAKAVEFLQAVGLNSHPS